MGGPEENDATEADRQAFDLVASAEERIKQALEPRALGPNQNTGTTYVLNGFNTVLSEGIAMSDNFNFYGQTTFINRPVDTVIQDFQNTYSSALGQGELSQLLRLVLSSETFLTRLKRRRLPQFMKLLETLPIHNMTQVRPARNWKGFEQPSAEQPT